MMDEQNLLDEYKKYDSLNKDKKHPLVKILVSYIKPSFLFKSKILTPIQLGKAVEKNDSKDGVQSDENLKWLHENCEFNDDFEGGISEHNRRIGFLTGTYWAWKNYEKLGDPEYFGSFGYRKLFDVSCLKNLSLYDGVFPQKQANYSNVTNKERFLCALGQRIFDVTNDIIHKVYPQDNSLFCQWLELTHSYFHEIYILKKEYFFQYCQWIFPILNELLNYTPDELSSDRKVNSLQLYRFNGDVRDIAFILERLNGFFLYKLAHTASFKYKEVALICENYEGGVQHRQELLKFLRKKVSNN